MLVDDYAGPTPVQAVLSPARAAYLVRAGSRTGVLRAIQEATTRWGGMAEPIIPVRVRGKVDGWWLQVLEASGVDGLVNVELSERDATTVAEHLHLPITPIRHIDHAGVTMFNTHPATLVAADPSLPPVVAAPGASLWEASLIGSFTPEHTDELLKESVPFRQVRDPHDAALSSLLGLTYLDQTMTLFSEYRSTNAPGNLPAILWITSSDSIRDCLFFWNLRALRSAARPQPMLLLPVSGVADWARFHRNLARVLVRPEEFSPDVVFASSTANLEKIQALAEILHLEPSARKFSSGMRWPAPQRSAPFDYAVNYELRPFFLFGRSYGQVVDFEAHAVRRKARLRFSPPRAIAKGQHLLVRFESSLFDGMPRQDVVAEKIHRNATWDGSALKLATASFGNMQFDVQIPTLREAAELLLSNRSIGAVASDKGKLAESLWSERDIGFVLDSGVFEVVGGLTTPRSKDLVRELRTMRDRGNPDFELAELASRWGGRTERRYRSVPELRSACGSQTGVALERLCGMRWAERGFETNCTRCGLRGFVRLSDVGGEASCTSCHVPASFTVSQGSPVVQYRLDPLVDRASDQGVIPHLLVMVALARRNEHTFLFGGVNLSFPDGTVGEADVLGLHAGRLVSGEVKTKASDFTGEQIDHDVRISSLLGADVHILAAPDRVPSEVRERAERAAGAEGMDLLILDSDDLRPAS